MTQKILICYDGSSDADRAIDAAAALLGPRHAVVLNVAPAMTIAEGVTATSSLVPGEAFEDLTRPKRYGVQKPARRMRVAPASTRRRAGRSRRRRGRGSSTSPTSSTWRRS